MHSTDFASANLTVGQLNAIIKKLGGEEDALRFLRGELVVGPRDLRDSPVWKTVKLGTGLRTADDFRTALKDGGNHIGNWGNDILGKPAFIARSEETEVNLVTPSVAELGFKDGATRADIYKRAVELGLELCPPEVGPQLRLQYKDQPNSEWLIIGMEPIAGSGDYLSVFGVGHDDGSRWLDGDYGRPDDFWGGHVRFVFVSRK